MDKKALIDIKQFRFLIFHLLTIITLTLPLLWQTAAAESSGKFNNYWFDQLKKYQTISSNRASDESYKEAADRYRQRLEDRRKKNNSVVENEATITAYDSAKPIDDIDGSSLENW